MLKIGSLLNEAKTFVEHGEWLPWLQRHTALPARTAQHYMAAAAWVDAKNATVAYLDLDYLSPGAIYALASGKFSAEIVEQVLTAAAARQRHIGEADVREIAKAGAKAAILQGIDEAGEHVLFGQDIAQRHRTNHRIFAGGGQANRRKAESSIIDHAHYRRNCA